MLAREARQCAPKGRLHLDWFAYRQAGQNCVLVDFAGQAICLRSLSGQPRTNFKFVHGSGELGPQCEFSNTSRSLPPIGIANLTASRRTHRDLLFLWRRLMLEE